MSGSRTTLTQSAQPGAPLQSHSPFADLPLTSAPGRGVVASDRDLLAIARVAARKGQLAALTSRVRERFGVELPQGPRRVEANGLAFVGVGVETWLAVAECGLASTGTPLTAGMPLDTGRRATAAGTALGAEANTDLNGFAPSLREAIDDLATVSDQLGSYAVLRLTGPRVRDALAKFVPLDLHPHVFDPGSAATTIASHIPVTLWRLADDSDGSAVFEIAAPRSYAGSFWHVVMESSAEFGFVRE
jgi:heterotetrameric sarcosine oxidase gamma subunit